MLPDTGGYITDIFTSIIGFVIVDLRLLIEKLPKIKIIPDQKTKNIT